MVFGARARKRSLEANQFLLIKTENQKHSLLPDEKKSQKRLQKTELNFLEIINI